MKRRMPRAGDRKARGLRMRADPAFASMGKDADKYLDMSDTDCAERRTFLYTASERLRSGHKQNKQTSKQRRDR
jgi:hypothetical protein